MKFTIQIDKSKARDTGMALILILLLLEWWLGGGLFLKLAVLVLVLNMVVPNVFKPLAYGWFGFAQVMGTVVSKILLFLVFILMVVPVGLFRKILGKDPLQIKKWKKSDDSVFVHRDHMYSLADIEKPF
jgi:polyferredoxin